MAKSAGTRNARGSGQRPPPSATSTGRAKRRKHITAATGLPGRPMNTAAPELPEGERPARLDRDLPEVQPAEPVDRAHDVVLVAARGAARGDHRIVLRRGLAQRRRHRLGAIGQDAKVGDPAAEPAEQPEENRAVGVVSGARRPAARPARAARRRSRAARPRAAGKPRAGPARRSRRRRRPAAGALSRLERHLARAHVLAGLAPVGAALHPRRDHHGIAARARRPPASGRNRRRLASARRSAPAALRLAAVGPANGWPAAARPGTREAGRPDAARSPWAKANPSTATLSKPGTSRGRSPARPGCGHAPRQAARSRVHHRPDAAQQRQRLGRRQPVGVVREAVVDQRARAILKCAVTSRSERPPV